MSRPRKTPVKVSLEVSSTEVSMPQTERAAPPKQTRQYTTFDRFGNIIAGGAVWLADGTVKHSNAQGHVWLPVEEVHSSEWVIK